MWHDMGWSGMWLGWLIIVIGIVLVVYVLTRLTTGGQIRTQPVELHESPLDIVKRRYAKGEINKEQYQQMKKDLE